MKVFQLMSLVCYAKLVQSANFDLRLMSSTEGFNRMTLHVMESGCMCVPYVVVFEANLAKQTAS